ncbi:hypothetical protein CLOSTASPAR_05287 [[Clostridium] asparagiforme DSM 15981]|uniref:Uncharacterized protein n=1 Tax=[Clostridium] asparagiforme DSM 15981 TaxID=518636 RepID=C0D7P0_9FIRM|nr:hypothetical protein CLOSTASPAR_05287 [[Clostridium] asparagiforme DSM 15981]
MGPAGPPHIGNVTHRIQKNVPYFLSWEVRNVFCVLRPGGVRLSAVNGG